MYWLAELCVRRPVFAIMLIMSLVVAGLVSYPSLGVDRFPNMDLPVVMVRAVYPGAAPAEVESEVTQLLEDAVATVAGIEELRSVSNEGSCFVIVTFSLSSDIDTAAQDVRDAVAGVVGRLPQGIDPPIVRKQDLDSSPILTLAVSGPRTPTELYVLADQYVKNVIESAPGVGEVTISGTEQRAIQVRIEASRLAAYQQSILQVRDAIARQNADVPGGRVDEGIRERILRTMGRVPHARDFADLVVDSVRGSNIRLGDLGTVEDSTKEVRRLSRLNGHPAITLRVQRQSGENTVQVVQGVRDRLGRARDLLPPDCEIQVLQDQSRYILAALHEIQNHLVFGSILAALTVLLFMRSWRSTLIASVAIPASVIATFAFMKFFGFTLNNVTMLALVLMVGVVIDDAIVVLENIFHFIEEKGVDPRQAAILATREIGPAVLATTLSLVIVFLPVSFLSSVTGRMLYEFGITATAAILVSMLVSFTLTPMMCSRLLKKGSDNSHGPSSRRGFYSLLEGGYMWCLRWAMKYRFLVLAVSLITMCANYPLYKTVKQDYIPTNVDESEFEVRLTAREGATLTATNDALLAVEKAVLEMPGVELVLTEVGSRGAGGVNQGEFFVRLQDIEKRTFSWSRLWQGLLHGDPQAAWRGNLTQNQVMQQVRLRLRQIPGIQASVRNLTSFRQGAPVDIDYTISGPDINTLARLSSDLAARVDKIPGIADVQTTLKLDKPELLVEIDRERAAALGVDVREIADTLRVAVGGDDRVSRYRDNTVDDAYDVELRLEGIDRRDINSISQLYVRARPNRLTSGGGGDSGGTVPTRIDNVVSFHYGTAAARIDRLDRQRMVAVRCNVEAGFGLADRIEAIHAAVEEMGLPLGFQTRVLGRGREMERTLNDFLSVFAMSLVFMYIVLAAQYEHLVHPFTILLSLPLAVPFGLLSLYWGNETLNLYSALGILVLFGVIKKNSILQVDHTNVLRSHGLPRDQAILQANRDRFRPILMTTISFVAGLLPLLIATGPGAEERRSIAVLTVGGQMLSLLLTLVAVPVIYSYLDDIGHLILGNRPDHAPPSPPDHAVVSKTEPVSVG